MLAAVQLASSIPDLSKDEKENDDPDIMKFTVEDNAVVFNGPETIEFAESYNLDTSQHLAEEIVFGEL